MSRLRPEARTNLVACLVLTSLVVAGSVGLTDASSPLHLRSTAIQVAFSVIGSIPVGKSPAGITYDPVNNFVYVANSGSNNVSVINSSTDRVAGTIYVSNVPWNAAVDTVHGCLYVTEGGSRNVTIVNLSTDRPIKSLPTGYFPSDATYDGSNGQVYVTAAGGPNVTVIDSATQTVVGSFVMNEPYFLAVDPIHNKLFVTEEETNFTGVSAVAVVDPSTEQITDWIPSTANEGIAFDSSNGLVYAVASGGFTAGTPDHVDVIDGATDRVVTSIDVGYSPREIAYDSANNYLYVVNSLSDNVTVVDGSSNTVVGWIPVGIVPYGVAIDSRNGNIYVTNTDTNNVTVIAGPVSSPSSGGGSGSSPFGGSLPSWVVWAIAAVVVAAGAAAVLLAVRRRPRAPWTSGAPPPPPGNLSP